MAKYNRKLNASIENEATVNRYVAANMKLLTATFADANHSTTDPALVNNFTMIVIDFYHTTKEVSWPKYDETKEIATNIQ